MNDEARRATASAEALSLNEIYQHAVEAANQLVDQLLVGTVDWQTFSRLDLLLGALPLPHGLYSWAVCRLANSRVYAQSDERFAAAFEARLLARRLAAEAFPVRRTPQGD